MKTDYMRNKRKKQTTAVDYEQIEKGYDIQVDAKSGNIVMVFANAKGRKVVEDVFPDVEWSTDAAFATSRWSADWLFTHIRVTKLPPHFEEKVPLSFASYDSLGAAVAMVLQSRAEPRRVLHWLGDAASGYHVNIYEMNVDTNLARSLFAEYVPPTTPTAG